MSTFMGKLEDPRVSFIILDHFKYEDAKDCTIFLLSHMHADHIVGLDDPRIGQLISHQPDTFFYCSAFTAKFISKHPKCQHIPINKIIDMEVRVPIIVKGGDTFVTITPLPASHCIGSFMFLLEFSDQRILYTGDIRLDAQQLRKFPELGNSDGSSIGINILHLDTTFASSQYEFFPKRQDAVAKMMEFARNMREPNIRLCLEASAGFGFEYIVRKLSEAFNQKIHLDKNHYENYYKYVEGWSRYLTTDEKEDVFIHLSLPKKTRGQCRYCSILNIRKLKVKKLRPCAMAFDKYCIKEEDESTWQVWDECNQRMRICYSSHCSFGELKGVVQFLKPGKILANVNKNNDPRLNEICYYFPSKPQIKAVKVEKGKLTTSVSSAIVNHFPLQTRQDSYEVALKKYGLPLE